MNLQTTAAFTAEQPEHTRQINGHLMGVRAGPQGGESHNGGCSYGRAIDGTTVMIIGQHAGMVLPYSTRLDRLMCWMVKMVLPSSVPGPG